MMMHHQEEHHEERLLFAVPKKGRMFDRVQGLLLGAGLHYHRPNRVDIAHCTSLPVTLVFLPASDIATYVADGKVDLGITGQDIIAEYGAPVHQLESLGFGQCRLCLQAPVKDMIKNAKQLVGKRIVTSFPKLAGRFFSTLEEEMEQDRQRSTSIKFVSGSVEAACALGLADGIVDLVETGTTMKAAGLEIVDTVLSTQAVLISNPHSTHQNLVKKIHQRILGYMTALKYHMISYNIHRSSLDIVKGITPGRKAPTVTQLADDDFVSVSAMVERKQSSDIMDRLMEAGATDILLFDISNCRV